MRKRGETVKRYKTEFLNDDEICVVVVGGVGVRIDVEVDCEK